MVLYPLFYFGQTHQHRIADDLKALRRNFIQRVILRMPIRISAELNNIERINSRAQKWGVVVIAYGVNTFTASMLAAILAVQMMLDWLGTRHADERLLKAARQVEAAVAALLSEGKTLTYDLIGEKKAAGCSEVGAAVEDKLRMMARGH